MSVKKAFNVGVFCVFNLAYGYFVSYILPSLLLTAFNKTNGYSPDEYDLAVFAWLALLLLTALFFVGNYFIIKKLAITKSQCIFAAIALAAGIVLGVIVTNQLYYINYTNILTELGL